MSEEIVIGRKYSVVIPKRVRKKVNLREGQHASIRVDAGRILIELLPLDPDAALDEVIGDFTYNEKEHEARVEELLKRIASSRH